MAPDVEPKEGAVRVRIPVQRDAAKTLFIDAEFTENGSVFLNSEDCTVIAYITADIPLPQPVEVAGKVEAEDA